MNDLLLLAILLEGPQHGYALKRQAGLITGHADMHNNLVYPLLRRFVREGWVTQKKAAGERGQTRLVYSLTARGRHTLIARLNDFNETAASSGDQFRLRVGLFPVLESSSRAAILAARESHLRRQAERLGSLESGMDIGKYGRQVVRFMRQEINAELAWIAQLRRLDHVGKRKAPNKRE